MSVQKRSVLLAQETDGYATLTDAHQTDAQTDASGSEDDGSAARAAAIEAAAWKRRKLQDDRMTREEGAVGDTRPRKGRPRQGRAPPRPFVVSHSLIAATTRSSRVTVGELATSGGHLAA